MAHLTRNLRQTDGPTKQRNYDLVLFTYTSPHYNYVAWLVHPFVANYVLGGPSLNRIAYNVLSVPDEGSRLFENFEEIFIATILNKVTQAKTYMLLQSLKQHKLKSAKGNFVCLSSFQLTFE
jgi:hypothetical protein